MLLNVENTFYDISPLEKHTVYPFQFAPPLPLGSDGPAMQFESMDDENAEIFNICMVKNCARSPGLKLLLSLYEYN